MNRPEHHTEVITKRTGMIDREILVTYGKHRHPGRGIAGHQLRHGATRCNRDERYLNPDRRGKFCLVQSSVRLLSEKLVDPTVTQEGSARVYFPSNRRTKAANRRALKAMANVD